MERLIFSILSIVLSLVAGSKNVDDEEVLAYSVAKALRYSDSLKPEIKRKHFFDWRVLALVLAITSYFPCNATRSLSASIVEVLAKGLIPLVTITTEIRNLARREITRCATLVSTCT